MVLHGTGHVKLSAELYLLSLVRLLYMALGLKTLCMGKSCQPMVRIPSVDVLLGSDLRATETSHDEQEQWKKLSKAVKQS